MLTHLQSLIQLSLAATFLLVGAPLQNSQPPPPDNLVQVAEQAFHEYDAGNRFETYLHSGDNLPQTMVMPQTFNPTPTAGLFRNHNYPSAHILSIVGRTDFAGTGIPIAVWSYPTTGDSFVVSLYLVHITGVTLAGKGKIVTGQNIYIARVGGSVDYKGHTFTAVDPAFPVFRLNQEYIFFGKQLTLDLYKVDRDGALAVTEDGVVETATPPQHVGLYRGRGKESILSEALAADQEIQSLHAGHKP